MNHNSPTFSTFLAATRSPYSLIFILAFCCFSYFYLDQPIALFFHQHLTENGYLIGKALTQFGVGTYYFIALGLLIIWFKFIAKNRIWTKKCYFLLMTMIVPGALCLILKVFVGRMRPTLLFKDNLYGFTFFQTKAAYLSFPSGHSLLITGIMLGLALLYTRLWWLFTLIFLTVSFSRILVSAHYLSDVIAGMYIAILIVPWLYQRFFKPCQTSSYLTNSKAGGPLRFLIRK